MNRNLLTLVLFEWYANVWKPRFLRFLLLLFLALPLSMLCLLASTAVSIRASSDTGLAGYIDESGKVASFAPDAAYIGLLVSYPDMQSARRGLETGKVPVVYRIPPDFPDDMHVLAYYPAGSPPGEEQHAVFKQWLRTVLKELWDETPAGTAHTHGDLPIRITRQVITDEDNRLVSAWSPTAEYLKIQALNDFLNALYLERRAAVLLFGLQAVLGWHSLFFLYRAIHREFDNDVLEVLYTSVPRRAFILGKALGVLVSAWTISIWYWPFAFYQILRGDASRLGYALALLGMLSLHILASLVLRTYLPMYFNLRTFSVRLVQRVLLLGSMSPYLLLLLLWQKPDGPLAVLLTLLPATATPTILIRSLFTDVPWWQMSIPALTIAGFILLVLRFSNAARRLAV